jgi:hypothetical protein
MLGEPVSTDQLVSECAEQQSSALSHRDAPIYMLMNIVAGQKLFFVEPAANAPPLKSIM